MEDQPEEYLGEEKTESAKALKGQCAWKAQRTGILECNKDVE